MARWVHLQLVVFHPVANRIPLDSLEEKGLLEPLDAFRHGGDGTGGAALQRAGGELRAGL